MKRALAAAILVALYVPVKVLGWWDDLQQLADRDDGGAL